MLLLFWGNLVFFSLALLAIELGLACIRQLLYPRVKSPSPNCHFECYFFLNQQMIALTEWVRKFSTPFV